MLHLFIGYYIGTKIGSEIYRYKYPDASYQPPPFWSWPK
jgi:hypothetical protein